MHIEYFLTLVTVGCIFWLSPKTAFAGNSGLSALQIRCLMLFKIVVGFLAACYFEKIFVATDYMGINELGMQEYKILLADPALFFKSIFTGIDHYGTGGMLQATGSYWADLRFSLLYKYVAIQNLITGGNFYLNSILFSSFVFWGHLALFKIYGQLYINNKKIIIAVCFVVPSLLLFTACINKDGIIFIAIAFASWAIFNLLNRISLVYSILLGLTCCIIFLFRNYVLIALLPAALAAFMCKKINIPKWIIVAVSYLCYTLVFFSSSYFTPIDLPSAVVKRKLDFALLEQGNTNLPMPELQPDFWSFIMNLPTALNHALLRPYLGEFPANSIFYIELELYFYLFLLLVFIVFKYRSGRILHPFNIYALGLFFCMIAIIGYTIPNAGAIVRYRSILWPFMLCPLMCNVDWLRIKKIVGL